jgi:hypothetical protein
METVSPSETLVPIYQTKQPQSLTKAKDNSSTTDNRCAASNFPSVIRIRSDTFTVIIYSINVPLWFSIIPKAHVKICSIFR